MFYALMAVLWLAVVLLDQLSKSWAAAALNPAGSVPAVPGVLDFRLLPNGNPGGAWGILSGRRGLLIAASAVLVIVILFLILSRRITDRASVAALTLVLAGGAGNLLDRIFRGCVVDFLQFSFWTSFPIFNVADIAVTAGVLIFCVRVLLSGEKREKT